MEDKRFDEPRLALNKIYTRGGDRGQTSLAGGQRVPKNSPRIECYGAVDELNAALGAAGVSVEEAAARRPELSVLGAIIRRVQHELFNLGSILATLPEDVRRDQRIRPVDGRRGKKSSGLKRRGPVGEHLPVAETDAGFPLKIHRQHATAERGDKIREQGAADAVPHRRRR